MLDVHKMLTSLVFMMVGVFIGGILIASLFINGTFVVFLLFPALMIIMLVAGGIWIKN